MWLLGTLLFVTYYQNISQLPKLFPLRRSQADLQSEKILGVFKCPRHFYAVDTASVQSFVSRCLVFPVWSFHYLDAYDEICHFRRSSLEICYLLCRLVQRFRNRTCIGNGWLKWGRSTSHEKTMNLQRKTVEGNESQQARLELVLLKWRCVSTILGWRIFCCIFCAEVSLFL
jgi:hypothetical protein